MNSEIAPRRARHTARLPPPRGPLFCRAHVEELAGEYQVVEVAADPWRAAPLLLELGQRGITVLDWPQSNERVCPASQRLRDLIVERKLRHPGDEHL